LHESAFRLRIIWCATSTQLHLENLPSTNQRNERILTQKIASKKIKWVCHAWCVSYSILSELKPSILNKKSREISILYWRKFPKRDRLSVKLWKIVLRNWTFCNGWAIESENNDNDGSQGKLSINCLHGVRKT
jgi:hypothetical protein